MKKSACFPLLLIFGCVLAANYGVVHNLISYSVSPEYFTSYQFGQNNIPVQYWNRTGACLVGIIGTWWMGLVIGIPLFLLAMIFPDVKSYIRHSLIAIVVVIFTTMVVGLSALAVSIYVESSRINQAGTMQEYSYLGGAFGIFTGFAYLLVTRYRIQKRMQREAIAVK